MRGVCLRIFSAAASSAVCVLPAAAHEIPVPHTHLPPVNVTAPEVKPPKRIARPKPSQVRAKRTATAVPDATTESKQRTMTRTVAVLAIIAALATSVQVYRVGDSGARAAWGERVSAGS